MKLRKLLLAFTSASLVSLAIAGEEMTTRIAIKMADHEMYGITSLVLDSDEIGFNLHDMQEGENRSVVDESGRTILITREADGYSLNVDGKTIKMPLFDGGHHGAVWIGEGDMDRNVEMHVMHDSSTAVASPMMDGVMILSGKPVDEATQRAITSMLEAAGHGGDVRFVDRESSGGIHGMKIIEKRVGVTQ